MPTTRNQVSRLRSGNTYKIGENVSRIFVVTKKKFASYKSKLKSLTTNSVQDYNTINLETTNTIPDYNNINLETTNTIPNYNNINLETTNTIPDHNIKLETASIIPIPTATSTFTDTKNLQSPDHFKRIRNMYKSGEIANRKFAITQKCSTFKPKSPTTNTIPDYNNITLETTNTIPITEGTLTITTTKSLQLPERFKCFGNVYKSEDNANRKYAITQKCSTFKPKSPTTNTIPDYNNITLETTNTIPITEGTSTFTDTKKLQSPDHFKRIRNMYKSGVIANRKFAITQKCSTFKPKSPTTNTIPDYNNITLETTNTIPITEGTSTFTAAKNLQLPERFKRLGNIYKSGVIANRKFAITQKCSTFKPKSPTTNTIPDYNNITLETTNTIPITEGTSTFTAAKNLQLPERFKRLGNIYKSGENANL